MNIYLHAIASRLVCTSSPGRFSAEINILRLAVIILLFIYSISDSAVKIAIKCAMKWWWRQDKTLKQATLFNDVQLVSLVCLVGCVSLISRIIIVLKCFQTF